MAGRASSPAATASSATSRLEPTTVSLVTERRLSRPWGLAGGEPGSTGDNLLLPGGDETRAERLPDKCTVQLRAGDVLRMLPPGGGGWGSAAPQQSIGNAAPCYCMAAQPTTAHCRWTDVRGPVRRAAYVWHPTHSASHGCDRQPGVSCQALEVAVGVKNRRLVSYRNSSDKAVDQLARGLSFCPTHPIQQCRGLVVGGLAPKELGSGEEPSKIP